MTKKIVWILILATYVTCSNCKDQENEDKINQYQDIELGLPRVSRVMDIGDDDKAWVIDDAITIQQRYSFVNVHTNRGNPLEFTFMHENYTKADPNVEWNLGAAPWSKSLNMSQTKVASFWKDLQPMVENLLEKKIELQHGELNYVRALDAIVPNVNRFCHPNRYILTVFFNDLWRLNNYAQMSFYSMMRNPNVTSELRLEITETVHPHENRAVLWPSCHVHMLRAPCVNYYQHLTYANLYVTASDKPAEAITVNKHEAPSKAMESLLAQFNFPNPQNVQEINFDKCLTRTFYDETKNRPIHVFDDLFTTEELRAWRELLLRSKPQMNPFDPAPLQDHDNVQWMSSYGVEDFANSVMWPRFQALLKYVSNETEWYPYDVALNYIRAGDHTRIHPDSEPHQHEFTLLLYLSEALTANDYGETVFVKKNFAGDGIHEFLGAGGDVYSTICAVAPKFGRLAIFRNNIEHAAHTPSTLFLGGRYTFAVKVSRTKRLSDIKRIYESMEAVSDVTPVLKKVNRQLQMGRHDDPNESKLSDDILQKLLVKVKKMALKSKSDSYTEALQEAYSF